MRNILLFAIAIILTLGIYIIDETLNELIKISTPEYVNVVPDKPLLEDNH